MYNTIGRDAFKELFPAGVGEALKMTPEENEKAINVDMEEVKEILQKNA